MKTTLKTIVERKKNELHENVSVTEDLFVKERDNVVEDTIHETL